MKLARRLVLMALALLIPTWSSAQVAGPVRGVTFFYLDDVTKPFSWVLTHQGDDDVKARLDLLFQHYKGAGVNWVRLLVFADHFPGEPYPTLPGSNRITQLNAFLENERTQGITFEVIIGAHTSSGYFNTPVPGCNASTLQQDKDHLDNWINGMHIEGHVGLVMMHGDLAPCMWNGTAIVCEGEANATPMATNHGQWIKAMWPYLKDTHRDLNLAYEVIGASYQPNASPEQLKALPQPLLHHPVVPLGPRAASPGYRPTSTDKG